MLRVIYICLKNKENIEYACKVREKFRNMMEKELVNVIYSDDKSEYAETSEGMLSDSLFITDTYNEVVTGMYAEGRIKGGIVGYGADCDIRTSYVIDEFADIPAQYYRQIFARLSGEPLVIAQTERLVIREISLADMDALFELYDTLSGCKYVESLYERKDEEEFTANYIKNMYAFYNYGLWLVFEKESGKLVGRAGIENRVIDGETCQELGYLIGSGYRKKGYAWEACKAILNYASEYLMLDELRVCIDKNNEPSIDLAQKLGFHSFEETTDGNMIIGRRRIV